MLYNYQLLINHGIVVVQHSLGAAQEEKMRHAFSRLYIYVALRSLAAV